MSSKAAKRRKSLSTNYSATQLKTAAGKEPGGTTNRLHEQMGYGYDAAGNLNYRTNNALVQTFNVNTLNELTTGTRNGRMTVAGTTTSPATNVTVNTTNAFLYADSTFASTNHNLVDGNNTFTAIAKDNYGRVDTNTSISYLPATPSFVYDLNGNLRTNGTRTFDYDDENQLTCITESNAWKSEFTYDGKMRRRIEKDFSWSGSAWVQTNEVRFVYDGNLPIQHRDSNNVPVLTLTRGLDLSGSFEGAGGIGGLLTMTENSALNTQLSTSHSYFHCDGNGNVTALVSANQIIVARYLYDPFGNTLSISGPKAFVNRYRFSSKPIHELSGMYYYLYRWYLLDLQRWLTHDPIGERGGLNLYSFVFNKPVNDVDPYGLQSEGAGEHECPSLDCWPKDKKGKYLKPHRGAYQVACTLWNKKCLDCCEERFPIQSKCKLCNATYDTCVKLCKLKEDECIKGGNSPAAPTPPTPRDVDPKAEP